MSQEKIQAIQVINDKEIKGFFGEYRWLSNFHEAPVEYQGVIYPSSENAYMAAKTLDPQEKSLFINVPPSTARKLGQKVKLRVDWEFIKYSVMYNILKDKFTRNKDLKEALLNTNEKYLEETNWWNDKYWGVCDGGGYNFLGLLLMDIREEFKDEDTRGHA